MKPSKKLIDEADELRPLMYQFIGEALNSFNILEDYVRTCIANLINIDDIPTIETLLGKLGSKQLIDIYQSLVTVESSSDAELDKKRKIVFSQLEKRTNERTNETCLFTQFGELSS